SPSPDRAPPPAKEGVQDRGDGRSPEKAQVSTSDQQPGGKLMKPYLELNQTLDALRKLVAELRDDGFLTVRAADPTLMHALYYHFGSWSRARELLDITDATRAEWKDHWNAEAAKCGMRNSNKFREQRVEELLEQQEAQREKKTLPEAVALVEGNSHF